MRLPLTLFLGLFVIVILLSILCINMPQMCYRVAFCLTLVKWE